MSFMDPSNKMEHFDRLKKEYCDRTPEYFEFFEYFHLTWISGKFYNINDWSYHKAFAKDSDEITFSKNFHITNNAVESCNAIINSCLHRGKEYSKVKIYYSEPNHK